MRFDIYQLGNRIVIKTIKNGWCTKVTPLKKEDAIKAIRNLKKENKIIEQCGMIRDTEIKQMI